MLKRLFNKDINTRVLPRIKLGNFVRYKLGSDPASGFVLANVKNISGSGVSFVSKTEISRGKFLEIDINFPGLEPIKVKAEVMRMVRMQAGDYEIGAHFITIDDRERLNLTRRIEFILKNIAERKSFWGQIKRIIKR